MLSYFSKDRERVSVYGGGGGELLALCVWKNEPLEASIKVALHT